MNCMRVMEIIRDAEGGMKIHFIALVKGMAERGIEVIALCNFSKDSRKELENAGVKVYPFPMPGKINIIADIKCISKMVMLMRQTKPDAVHCHGFKAGLLGRAAGSIAGARLVYTVHNFTGYGRSKSGKNMINRIEKWMAARTGAIICVSRALKMSMKDAGIDEEKLHVVYNSIPCWPAADRSRVRRKYNIEDSIIIGTVARLIPSKGIDILLKAAAPVLQEYPRARILIAGSGPEEYRLKELAQSLRISDKVIFAGRVSGIQDYYAAFDIFVLPTLSEGLGISVLEAMSFGLPVIASAAGGIPEWVIHGRNGCFVEPGNVFELRSALKSLIEDPDKAGEYGRMAKQTTQKGLSEQEMIDKTLSVINAVL